MYNQLKVEFYKLRKSLFFYLAILGFLTASVLMAVSQISQGREITGQSAFINSISDTSLLFLLSLFVSYFIGNDFANRIIDNEIRIGYSRLSVILSRVIIALPFTALLYLFYSVPYALIMGSVNGFVSYITVTEFLMRTSLFILQLVSILSFSALIMFWCKKPALGMMLSVCFTVVTCNVLRNIMNDNAAFSLTPFYRITMNNINIMTAQDALISFMSAIVTIVIALLMTYFVFRKAELK